MKKKLAKIKYLPNNFQIIEAGDYVECAVSKKKILIEDLNYWNVDLQEAYFSYKESQQKREEKYWVKLLFPPIVRPDPILWFI